MWRLESEQGRWQTTQFQFQVDLRRPDRGWSDVRVDQKAYTDHLFELRLPGESNDQTLTDSYVRQSDLVVTYAQSSDRTVLPQIVWRVIRDGQLRVGVECILSMQTSLLASHPGVSIRFRLAGELLNVSAAGAERIASGPHRWDEPTVLLQRPDKGEHSLALLMHPADFVRLDVCPTADEGWQADFAAFPESLEKGVIRRARLQAVYVSRHADVELAQLCANELKEAAPPLTT